MLTSDRQVTLREECPECGGKAKPVKPITIESLVTEEARARVGGAGGFRFCAGPACDVAYFRPADGARIARSEVRVRIGQKETGSPHPVCYCFDHTVEEIDDEVARTGASNVLDDITGKCRQGLDRCEETNPQGSCCLGNVRRAVKEAQQRHARVPATEAGGSTAEGGEICCAARGAEAPAARAERPRNVGLWATTGAVPSAILSSACCWLPLLLIAFGASAAGVAGFFEAYRPYLLGTTGLLLAGGFYLVYFRKERCGPGEACAAPNPRLRRLNKAMLWVATSVVLAFTLFPNYIGVLLGHSETQAEAMPTTSGDDGRRVEVAVRGMTCAGCASGLHARLGGLPEVRAARVDYDSASVAVVLAPDASIETVLRAIAAEGFKGEVKGQAAPSAPRR